MKVTTNFGTVKVVMLKGEKGDTGENGYFEDLTEEQVESLKSDIRAYYKKVEGTYTTMGELEQTIPINVPGYTSADVLTVNIEGLNLVDGVDYTINGNNITLVEPITHVGTRVNFCALRSFAVNVSDFDELKAEEAHRAYETVAAMQADTSLANGMIVRTLGFHSAGDGGAALYIIGSTGTANGMDVIACSNSLKATLKTGLNNPACYGADSSGSYDSSDAIQKCIIENIGGTIMFTPGKYKITESIELPFDMDKKVSIIGNGCTIFTEEEIESFVIAGVDRTDDHANYAGKAVSTIENIFFDGTDGTVENVIYIANGFKDLHVVNIQSLNTLNGIIIGSDTTDPYSGLAKTPNDALITECMLYGNGSEYDGSGIVTYGTDSKIFNCRLYGYRTGFKVYGGLEVLLTHVLLRWHDQDQVWNPYPIDSNEWNELYPQTSFAELYSPARIVDCYADSVYSFLKINNAFPIVFTNNFYYNSRSNVSCCLFDINTTLPRITICNNYFHIPEITNGDYSEIYGIRFRQDISSKDSLIQIKDNQYSNDKNLQVFDLLNVDIGKVRQSKKVSALDADKWYIFGCIPVAGTKWAGTNFKRLHICGVNIFLDMYLLCGYLGTSVNSSTGTLPSVVKLANTLPATSSMAQYTLGIFYDYPYGTNDVCWYLAFKKNNGAVSTNDALFTIESVESTFSDIYNYFSAGAGLGNRVQDGLINTIDSITPNGRTVSDFQTPIFTFDLYTLV